MVKTEQQLRFIVNTHNYGCILFRNCIVRHCFTFANMVNCHKTKKRKGTDFLFTSNTDSMYAAKATVPPPRPFVRTFSTAQRCKWSPTVVNTYIRERPDAYKPLSIFLLSPLLSWLANAETTQNLISDYAIGRTSQGNANDNAFFITHVQDIILASCGFNPRMKLTEARELPFLQISKTAKHIHEAVVEIADWIAAVEQSDTAGRVLLTLYSEAEGQSIQTRYARNKYLTKCFDRLVDFYGAQLSDDYDRLTVKAPVPDLGKYSYAYHDVRVLLREYQRVVWEAQQSRDPAMQFFATPDNPDIYKDIELPDEKYSQAYNIAEILKIVQGAAELLKTYPGGPMPYAIINDILTRAQSGDDIRMAAKDNADRVGVGVDNYVYKKNVAFTLLGLILWGGTIDDMISLLTAVRK